MERTHSILRERAINAFNRGTFRRVKLLHESERILFNKTKSDCNKYLILGIINDLAIDLPYGQI